MELPVNSPEEYFQVYVHFFELVGHETTEAEELSVKLHERILASVIVRLIMDDPKEKELFEQFKQIKESTQLEKFLMENFPPELVQRLLEMHTVGIMKEYLHSINEDLNDTQKVLIASYLDGLSRQAN